MNATLALSNNIVTIDYNDLPQEVVNHTKMSILDTIGVMLAATTLGEGCKELIELATEYGGKPESTILGFGNKIPALMAAFANGALCHPLDYDDAHDLAHVHPIRLAHCK